MTAIAARSRLVIFERAFEPASPRIFTSTEDDLKTSPAIKIFPSTDIMVAYNPYWETITREVVNTAGPAMSGVPRGTTPSSLLGTRLCFVGLTISANAKQKSIAPPALILSRWLIS